MTFLVPSFAGFGNILQAQQPFVTLDNKEATNRRFPSSPSLFYLERQSYTYFRRNFFSVSNRCALADVGRYLSPGQLLGPTPRCPLANRSACYIPQHLPCSTMSRSPDDAELKPRPTRHRLYSMRSHTPQGDPPGSARRPTAPAAPQQRRSSGSGIARPITSLRDSTRVSRASRQNISANSC